MNIIFTPQRRDDALLLSVSGETITVNGVEYDFSVIPEGASLEAEATDCMYFVGDISRTDGVLSVAVILPHRQDPNQPIAFPESVSVTTGVVIDTANAIYPWSRS